MKSRMGDKSVSIILPLYNEAENISKLILEIDYILKLSEFTGEIIVIDDASTDKSVFVAKQVLEKLDLVNQLISNNTRTGLAASILLGIQTSIFDTFIVMDTDLTHSPSDLNLLLHQSEFFDVVVASRFCYGGNMENQSLYYSSYLLNLFIRIVCRTQIQDNTGGFFMGKKSKLKNILSEKVFYGFGEYFIRFIKICQDHALKILEVPSTYNNRNAGLKKSKRFKMFFSYFKTAVKVRFLKVN